MAMTGFGEFVVFDVWEMVVVMVVVTVWDMLMVVEVVDNGLG